jgi:hypothetical protein
MVASACTDSGDFHVFDTRIGQVDRSNRVIRTKCLQLFTHAWTDTHSALLGFGDGSIRLFDIRQPQNCVVQFHDPLVDRIGSITLDPQRRFFVTFGNPEFSVWRSAADSHFTLWHHDPLSVSKLQLDLDPFYKNDGAFVLTGGRKNGTFVTTDAHVLMHFIQHLYCSSRFVTLSHANRILTVRTQTLSSVANRQGFICMYDAQTTEQVIKFCSCCLYSHLTSLCIPRTLHACFRAAYVLYRGSNMTPALTCINIQSNCRLQSHLYLDAKRDVLLRR